MPKILVVEDEEQIRKLYREHLEEEYQIIETADATEALALAMQQKPDCILLDLMLPQFSGFELCQTFSSLSLTQLIPIFVITGKPAAEYREFCLNLGAADYFEKPVDFKRLKTCLAAVVDTKRAERRAEGRVRLIVILKLSGTDVKGKKFELLTATENVSASGFLCSCPEWLEPGAIVQVCLRGRGEHYVGSARVVRVEWRDTPWQRYGFQFVTRPHQWVLE